MTCTDVFLGTHKVRKYDAWYRHITLAMPAQAFLAVTAKTEKGSADRDDGLIPFSVNEIRHLHAALTCTPHPRSHIEA